MKWVFKSKGYPYSLILLKSINLVKGYMQVTVVDYTESFSLVSTDTSTIIMIGITFFHEEKVLFSDICDVEAAFLYPDIPVDIFI